VNDVGIDAMVQRHAGYRGARQPRLANDLILEFGAYNSDSALHER
jgi:hypothetical protein